MIQGTIDDIFFTMDFARETPEVLMLKRTNLI